MKTIVKYNSKLTDENNNLIIQLVIDDWSSKRSIADLSKDKVYEIEFKEKKSKRSIQQNKFMWALIHEIAKIQQEEEMDIYCNLLQEANANYEFVMADDKAKEGLLKGFRAIKLIRYETFKNKQFGVYKCYTGSSKFTVSEMTQLLEITLKWASELGIDTDLVNY